MTVAQPVFSVPDENTHFINAYSVFHNDSKDESFGRYWKYSQMLPRLLETIHIFRNFL